MTNNSKVMALIIKNAHFNSALFLRQPYLPLHELRTNPEAIDKFCKGVRLTTLARWEEAMMLINNA